MPSPDVIESFISRWENSGAAERANYPEQFLGLELSPNAVAIAQLVLWIGYFQWQRKTTGKADTGDRCHSARSRCCKTAACSAMSLTTAPSCVYDFGDPHYLFVAPLRIFRDNPDLTEPLLLLFVYEHSPCRVCRSEAFRLMMERGICPDWVMEEAQWDAMPGIREMATGAQPWPLSGRDQFTLISQIHASDPAATAEQLSALFGRKNQKRKGMRVKLRVNSWSGGLPPAISAALRFRSADAHEKANE